jgi:hypothetical protein
MEGKKKVLKIRPRYISTELITNVRSTVDISLCLLQIGLVLKLTPAVEFSPRMSACAQVPKLTRR